MIKKETKKTTISDVITKEPIRRQQFRHFSITSNVLKQHLRLHYPEFTLFRFSLKSVRQEKDFRGNFSRTPAQFPVIT